MVYNKFPTDYCYGCGACVSKCPTGYLTMEADENGFFYPQFGSKNFCVKCNQCETVCPVLQYRNAERKQPDVYAAYALDETIRLESSSGGIFYVLAMHHLRQGGVVCAAAYDKNFAVRHICITSPEKLPQLQGAKYAQSDLGSSFRDIKAYLDRGTPVLFCGTPCQVEGLKAFLGKEETFLICVDFVCHGVPSPSVWKAYYHYRIDRDSAGTKPVRIEQRSKVLGWSHYRYATRFTYPQDTYVTIPSHEDLFMRLFIKNCISRKSCSLCKFKGCNRRSDITLGDFWGIWDIAPEMDDDKGTSLVLVHSIAGRELLTQVQAELMVKKVALHDASAQNQSLLKASMEHPKRDAILTFAREGNFDAAEKLILHNSQKKNRFLSKIKRLLAKG